MSRETILEEFKLFSLGTDGIGGWFTQQTDGRVFQRLEQIEENPLTKVQLNQLLAFGHEAPVSDDFFRYYWLKEPQEHPYEVSSLPGFDASWVDRSAITSLSHLKWGFYRLFIDALLYFGNVRTGYRILRSLHKDELKQFFSQRRFNSKDIRQRGPALPLEAIPKDDRYLISEMACKSYGDSPESPGELKDALIIALREYKLRGGGGPIAIKRLIEGDIGSKQYAGRQTEFLFSADDVLEETVESEQDLEQKYDRVSRQFFKARDGALANSDYYLSMVNDLDVYVATSMRTRQDFRGMADVCEKIFADDKLQRLNLRYFDPTLSAAAGHEDKGLIECLMVKCTKALVYCAGERESWGKDAEAAMGLSLGKPVIFYCTEEQRTRFYREVHPLSRLIEFETGVAVGAMVTDTIADVSELLFRIFENKMEYELEHPKEGYLRVRERLTNSVVRIQTNNRMLSETFWNHYHNRDSVSTARGGA